MIRIRPPQCVLRGAIWSESDAGTTRLAAVDSAGSTFVPPPYAATTTRDGPGGIRALQLPFAAVVATATCENCRDPLSGATKTRTGCPPSALPSVVPSQPL